MFAQLSLFLWIHFVAAVYAIASGAVVLAMRKGTSRHRWIGTSYIVAMVLVLVSVAFVPAKVMPFFGTSFGFFHALMVFGGVSLLIGLHALWRWHRYREPKALRQHQIRLAYSYTGLLMAGFSQLATNPRFGLVSMSSMVQFWILFALVNAAILGVGTYVIQTRLAKGDPLRWKPA